MQNKNKIALHKGCLSWDDTYTQTHIRTATSTDK